MPSLDVEAKIATRIREAREYLELSIDELANMLGVSAQDIEETEAAEVPVSAALLSEIANTLGRSLEYFTGEVSATLASDRTAFLARAAESLSDQDMGELQRFAQYLRSRSESSAA